MLTLSAPAKINLSLRVLGRREDGFHEIESVMCPLDLADEIDLERLPPLDPTDGAKPRVRFECDDASLPIDGSNLAVRAAEIFLAHAGLPENTVVRVALRKRVPHGAGLGGGSSDAATVLLGLNTLFETGCDTATLAILGAQLGSDVAFFIYRSAAVCRGRGELVEPLPDFAPRLPVLLLKPTFGVPTPWAYRRWAASRDVPGAAYGAQRFPWGELVNDLERPVFEKYLYLAAIKNWLLAQPEIAGALLSGSGSTVLGVLRDDASNDLEARARRELGADLWVCRTRTI